MVWTCFTDSEGLCTCKLVCVYMSSGIEGWNQDFSLGMALVGTRSHLFQIQTEQWVLKPRIPLMGWVLMCLVGFFFICPPIPVCLHYK